MAGPSLIADRYELKEPLGEGGMGIVYRAYDIRTRSFVALKTMRDSTDPVAVNLFSKEWSVLASISHPNIVPIRDVGEFEERGQKKPFFVMPLLPGVTLARLIETSSPRLTVEHVVDIITQVCRGLQAAHERGLVHRDIKPTNIFVMDDDTAQIIDFGVVYLAGTQSVTGHKGTWQYMAPEQLDLKPASPVSDLFSLGVVCYETLTGRKPFSRKTPADTADAIRRYIPPPICDINPTVSRLISMVLHKAMAKQPIHRFTSAKDFGETLQKAHHNQPIDRFDPAKIQPRIERARKAFESGDPEFASEILTELESEGHIDPEIGLVRAKIDQAQRQKKIRQLLEAARTRLEQDEIPLAFEKLQEVLEIDPDNVEAHAMRTAVEKQRNERQIESWLSLARRHLERHDFAEARQALTEVFKIHPSNTDAFDLLNETQFREQEAVRIRTEKEQLYGSAMKAYQNGAISTALSRLEHLLDIGRQTPDASLPDRDALYQSFYNQVRSDRDSIHNAYEEARRQLAEHNFARTFEICDEFMAKYPGDALFQALKLEAVEQQRQELSSYIAEIGRRADEEPDLDRKVNILKEACERFPNEQQFQQTLKLTRERRDLVLSIVAKARHYEEKGLFTEAIGEWDTLRKIYSKYPGIDIEVSRLMKRRDQQVKDEAKTRLIEQIDRALDTGEFAQAVDLAAGALAEHTQDQELAGLERLARQGLERSLEAGKLYDQAQQLLGEKRYKEAIESFRLALELDPKNRRVREALVNVLAEQARPLVDAGDWRTAEPIVQQASELDATNSMTRSLRTLVADSKRKEFVSQCLTEARELRDRGDVEGALGKIGAGLVQYPNEPRLVQLQTTLQSGLQDVRRQKERPSDVQALRGILQSLTQSNNPAAMASHLEQSHSIAGKHPDDPEIGSLVAEIRERAGTLAPTEAIGASIFSNDNSTILLPGSPSGQGTGTAVQPARVPQPTPPPRPSQATPATGSRKGGFAWLLAPMKAAAGNIGRALKRPASVEISGAGQHRAGTLEIAHVLFIDIVSYSLLTTDEQSDAIQQLQEVVRLVPDVKQAVAAGQVICLPTGDGMALAFFHDPIAPLRCARQISFALRQGLRFQVRMGVHSGPTYRHADINASANLAGGGINLAQRVMDCGDGGHILVSKAVADTLLQLSEWRAAVHELGEHEVKHGLRIQIFNIFDRDRNFGNSDLPSRLQGGTVSSVSERALDVAMAREIPIYKPAELVALVRQLESEGLKGILESDPESNVAPGEVRSKPLTIEFPVNEKSRSGSYDQKERLSPVDLTIKITSPDFEPKSQSKVIRIPPFADSEACTFLLTPRQLGELRVNVELYTGSVALVSRMLKTHSTTSDRLPNEIPKAVLSIPLTVFVQPSQVAAYASKPTDITEAGASIFQSDPLLTPTKDRAAQIAQTDAATGRSRSGLLGKLSRTYSPDEVLVPKKPAAANVGGIPTRPVWRSLSGFHTAIIGIVVVLIGAAIIARLPHRSAPPPTKAVAVSEASVQIQTTPADAIVTVNGEVRSGTISLPSNGTYNVMVSRLGYRTLHEEALRPDARWIFTLDPAPIHLSLSTSEKTGRLFVDDAEKADLQAGLPQDLELPTDGANHVLALRNGNREIFSFTFSGKAGEVPLVSAPKPRDLIVVGSLGTEAAVYSGSPALRANLSGADPQAIPADGLKLHTVSATNNELSFSNSDLPKIPIESGNAPALYVGLNADTNIASLNVQSTVPSAQLFVDGVEIKSSKPGAWRPITRKPGKYTVLVKAEGYEDHQEQVELAKGQARQLTVALAPAAVAITTAYLAIEGGTPGAEVIIDGKASKALDSAGSARIEVSPGPHKIAFRKEFFEPSTDIPQNFARGQEIKIDANEAKLKEYGTLAFRITPADAQVSYRRGDQGEMQHARGRDSVRVPEGKYSITVEGSGVPSQTRNDVTVSSGQTASVDMSLTAVVASTKPPVIEPVRGRPLESLFEKPEQVTTMGDWWISKIQAEYVFLKPGATRQFNLAFLNPGKNFLGRQKKMEWVIGYASDKDKIVYDFDGKKLNRKAYVAGKSENSSVACQTTDKAFQFQISIQASRVSVQSPACDQLDSYESPAGDLTKEKIGVKPNVEFIIR